MAFRGNVVMTCHTGYFEQLSYTLLYARNKMTWEDYNAGVAKVDINMYGSTDHTTMAARYSASSGPGVQTQLYNYGNRHSTLSYEMGCWHHT